MTSRIHNHVAAICVSSLVTLTACNGNGTPDVTAPVPTRAPTTTIDPDASTTTTSTTEPPLVTTLATEPTSTDTTVDVGEGFLPADLGPRVDAAPGVNSPGEIVELLDNVWIFVPSEPDPNDASVLPPLPEDREILAAYAYGLRAMYQQITVPPISPQPSADLAARLSAEYLARYVKSTLIPRSGQGDYQDASAGVLLRPVVIADPRSENEAFIFDCILDGGEWVRADGSLDDGEIPGSARLPLSARIKLIDGTWILDGLSTDDRACI
jgi:hypothetical protein